MAPLPPKKLVWKSLSGTIDICIWLAIFHSLDFKTPYTYLAIGGIFVWSIISEVGSHWIMGEKK